ncbi:MAG: hypothetical protein U9R23_01420 [Candidatus Cloacimonadota bacterium]|nr:hypothetical protein [Candidatus Cloacimonadota bacterium]
MVLNVKIIQNDSFIGIIGGIMSGAFLGQFENSITNRRVSIPQSFRRLFSSASRMQVIAIRGRQNTIYIFPWDNWKDLESKLEKGTDEEKDLLKKFRIYATLLTVEGPGRILLPKNLLDIANITDKAMILGEGSYFSLWNPDNFKKYLAEIDKEYDMILQRNDHIL